MSNIDTANTATSSVATDTDAQLAQNELSPELQRYKQLMQLVGESLKEVAENIKRVSRDKYAHLIEQISKLQPFDAQHQEDLAATFEIKPEQLLDPDFLYHLADVINNFGSAELTYIHLNSIMMAISAISNAIGMMILRKVGLRGTELYVAAGFMAAKSALGLALQRHGNKTTKKRGLKVSTWVFPALARGVRFLAREIETAKYQQNSTIDSQ